ncbi:branched-chain amino acid ABC transporter permease [Brucella gallinifaecis]|uniref:Branched-chain amino acid ABC transporter permease n=1 Tax=Brucella gallinifaecis TaxID=215590 RepID=A0A502BLI9_9HYPH|nr:branched-chain amino acid ABC transporter permease [Brucella gallinifaecis]TPF74697.1 branched-chain amino acid ABC transporter permease [Brucella gallinifaecis]
MTSLIIQQTINALTIGAIYALIALGYTMVYGVLRLINFAHSEMFMLGGYVALVALSAFAVASGFSYVFVVMLVMAVTFVAVGSVGVITERAAYKPLRNSSRLAPMLSALGVSMALQAAMQLIAGPQPIAFPALVDPERFEIAGASITYLQIFIVTLSIVLMYALQFLINRTRLGVLVRAVAENHHTAALLGVNVNRTISLIFFVGPGLGALGGVLYGSYYGLVSPTMGVVVGLKAFTAAILGGIGSIPGAMIGGFVLAFLEVFGTALLPIVSHGVLGTEYRDIFAFAVLIAVLLFRPAGLLGENVTEESGVTKREF